MPTGSGKTHVSMPGENLPSEQGLKQRVLRPGMPSGYDRSKHFHQNKD